MKTWTATMVTCLLFASISLLAQNPVPDPDTTSAPIKQGDPALKTLPSGLDYTEDLRHISAEELPSKVRQTLDSNAEFDAWHEAVFYHDRNKDEYIVEVTREGKVTSYRFNNEGQPITEEK